MTLAKLRFIALHMMSARMKPDAPSSAPATISNLLPSAKPIADAASPAYLLSSAMTVGAFDQNMLDILYLLVDRPLMELLSRVAVHHYAEYPRGPVYGGKDGKLRWQRERRAIISAILDGDPERARFEALRRRREIMQRLDASI